MDNLEQLTIDLYKEFKSQAEKYAKYEAEEEVYNNSLIFRTKKETFNYVATKLKNNFDWLEIDIT